MTATPYRARVGKRRAFATSQEAIAYERGFSNFPTQPWGLPNSPAAQGWADAEEALAEALSVSEEHRAMVLA